MINYVTLILQGIIKEPPKYFIEYLIRKQKKLEKEFVEADEFFERCNDVVNSFNKDIDRQFFERQQELYFMLDHAENRTSYFGNENNDLTYDEQCEKLIKNCNVQLNGLSRDNYGVHLLSFTQSRELKVFTGHLNTGNIRYIKQCIDKAKNRVTQVKNNKTPQQKAPGKNQKSILKSSLSDLAGLKPDNVEIVYLRLYDRWKFDNSDEVWMDGKFLPKKEKELIRASLYNFKSNPKEIITSDIQDGFPLTEEMFIWEQINKYGEINANIKYDENVRTEKNRLKAYLNFLSERLEQLEAVQETDKSDEKYKDCLWFKIGLFFAKGVPQKLYAECKTEKGHFKKITIKLGFKEGHRPYFSETLNNTTKNHLNIYSDPDKLLKIQDHCLKNKIPIVESFSKHLPPD